MRNSLDISIQAIVFIKWTKKSLILLIGLALPKILVGLFQASIWLIYVAAPLYYIENKFHPIDSYVKEDQYWMKLVNYAAIYVLLLILQFATLRSFSKRELLGLALKNQGQQRGFFIKNFLWLLSLIFCILAIPSLSGIMRLRSDYTERKEAHLKSKLLKRESVNDQRAIDKENYSCKVFFTHALNSMLMGYVDLAIKIAEICVYILVKISQGIMFVLPWRKTILDEKLTRAKNQYAGAAIIIIEGFQTIIDLILFTVLLPIIFVLTPYKFPYVKRDFQTMEANKWRGMVFVYLLKTITDFPYIVMFLVICLSVVQAFRMRRNIYKDLAEKNKVIEETNSRLSQSKLQMKLEVGDLLKDSIVEHFLELLEVIAKAILFFIGITLFILSCLVTPWRLYGNILMLGKIRDKYKEDFKKKDNAKLMGKAMIKNIQDSIFDITVLILTLDYLISNFLVIWRVRGHIENIKSDCTHFKANISENQDLIILTFGSRIRTNFKNFFLDILVLILCIFNIFGFWRYSFLKRKIQANKLERYDLIMNPLLTICDLPWLALVILCFVTMPWRSYTYYRLSLVHPHFGNDVYGLLDYLYLPVILIAMLNPIHIVVMMNLFKHDMQYEVIYKFNNCEYLRRKVIRFYCVKGFHDLWQYFILLPLNMMTLYYVPLFRYLLKSQSRFLPLWDDDKFKLEVSPDLYEACNFFKVRNQVQDYFQPQDARCIVKIVNAEFLKNLPYLPLMSLTIFFNPYRTYEFFFLSDHSFKNFNLQTVSDISSNESKKRVDIVIKFKESLTDLLALLSTLLIILTGFRSLYLISILSVNGHLTYFNGFLKRVSKSTILIIKLQQIETILKDKEKIKAKKENYLSKKYCILLTLLELFMDILVSPFIIAYFVLIPWRLSELFAIAVSQYERVPTKKVNKKHYVKEINQGHYPKRVQVIGHLLNYIFTDYITILMSAILLVTFWRGLNTLVFLKNFYRHKVSQDKHEIEYLDTIIKDTPLRVFIQREFYYLMTDLFFLTLTIMTFLMVFQAKTLYLRLKQIFNKRKQREEIQAFNVLKSIKMMAKFKKEISIEVDEKSAGQKKIVDLNKNVMSLLLPYLKQNEIQNVERMNKKMCVFANFWPVWKNVYQDIHMKDPRIPKATLDMTEEEAAKLDYRGVCKRCFLFVKNNCQEEIIPELVDYFKGYRRVVLEEFYYSLIEFPTIYLYPIRFLAFIFNKVRRVMEIGYFSLDAVWFSHLNLPKQVLVQMVFNYTRHDQYHQYDQGLGGISEYPWAQLTLDLLKIYCMIVNTVEQAMTYFALYLAKLVSAGPVGNLRTRQYIPNQHEYNISIAAPLYLVQTIICVPAFLFAWHPVVIMIFCLGQKLFAQTSHWYTEEINMIWIFIVCVDMLVYYYDQMSHFNGCYQFIQPEMTFILLGRFIKFVIRLILRPLKAAANKSLDIGKVIGNLLVKITSSAFKTIANFIEQIGYLIYNVLKAILNKIWTGSRFTFELLMIPVKGVSSLYFAIFKFLLVALRSLGIIGEFIFTIFGLVWLLWPLFLAYRIGKTEFYIPGVILTIILIVQGRKVIISNQ